MAAIVLAWVCSLSAFPQIDLPAERIAMLRGDVEGVITRLEGTLMSDAILRDTLLHARTLEALGEQHYRLSDIDEAHRLWVQAKELRVRRYGKNTPEYGVALAYMARYHNYMSAAQIDHQQEAIKAGDEACLLIRQQRGEVSAQEELLALREQAYAHKVGYGPTGTGTDPELLKARSLYHGALQLAERHRDVIGMAQIHHDLGNTYTDRAIPLREQPEKQAEVVQLAQYHYRRSLALLGSAGLDPSEAAMMDHFTLGLLYQYAYDRDSLYQGIAEIDEALRTLIDLSGDKGGGDPVRYVSALRNRAQMVELYHYMVKFLMELNESKPDPKLLDEAIRTNEVSIAYWEAMMREYRSKAMFKVAGSYGHFPHRQGAILYALRYWSKGSKSDAVTSLLLSDRDRNAQLQRRKFQQGRDALDDSDFALKASEVKASAGKLIICYHHDVAYVIDEQGLEIVQLPPVPADPTRSFGRFNEFAIDSLGADPGAFARDGSVLYRTLLEPILKDRTQRDLVIIPLGSFANLAFEGLPMDPSARTWNDMPFVGDRYSVRYATTLEQALSANAIDLDERAALALVEVDTLSTLPFARSLIERLSSEMRNAVLLSSMKSNDLLQELGLPGLLHVATHAHAPDEPDALPYLITGDGRFVADALWDHTVQKQLVVLSTCSSGSGRAYIGQGVLSMGQSFLDAGAGAVVHTLWPVDDHATTEILQRMYVGMSEGLTATQALHQAKLEFRDAHQNDGLSHPFYWAGLVISGQDVAFARDRSRVPLYITLGLLAAGAVLFIYKRSKRSLTRSTSPGSAAG